MPEYIPKVNYPDALAEKAIELRYSQPQPTQALYNALGQVGSSVGKSINNELETQKQLKDKMNLMKQQQAGEMDIEKMKQPIHTVSAQDDDLLKYGYNVGDQITLKERMAHMSNAVKELKASQDMVKITSDIAQKTGLGVGSTVHRTVVSAAMANNVANAKVDLYKRLNDLNRNDKKGYEAVGLATKRWKEVMDRFDSTDQEKMAATKDLQTISKQYSIPFNIPEAEPEAPPEKKKSIMESIYDMANSMNEFIHGDALKEKENQEALDWANKNPNDARSVKIHEKLGK